MHLITARRSIVLVMFLVFFTSMANSTLAQGIDPSLAGDPIDTCDLPALASLVVDEGIELHSLLAQLDPDCREAFLDAYTTEESYTLSPVADVSHVSDAAGTASVRCYSGTTAHEVRILGDLQYSVMAQGELCVNDIVGPGPGITSFWASTWVAPAGNNWSCTLSHTVYYGLRGSASWNQFGQRWDQYACTNQVSSANRISHGAICMYQSGGYEYCPWF